MGCAPSCVPGQPRRFGGGVGPVAHGGHSHPLDALRHPSVDLKPHVTNTHLDMEKNRLETPVPMIPDKRAAPVVSNTRAEKHWMPLVRDEKETFHGAVNQSKPLEKVKMMATPSPVPVDSVRQSPGSALEKPTVTIMETLGEEKMDVKSATSADNNDMVVPTPTKSEVPVSEHGDAPVSKRATPVSRKSVSLRTPSMVGSVANDAHKRPSSSDDAGDMMKPFDKPKSSASEQGDSPIPRRSSPVSRKSVSIRTPDMSEGTQRVRPSSADHSGSRARSNSAPISRRSTPTSRRSTPTSRRSTLSHLPAKSKSVVKDTLQVPSRSRSSRKRSKTKRMSGSSRVSQEPALTPTIEVSEETSKSELAPQEVPQDVPYLEPYGFGLCVRELKQKISTEAVLPANDVTATSVSPTNTEEPVLERCSILEVEERLKQMEAGSYEAVIHETNDTEQIQTPVMSRPIERASAGIIPLSSDNGLTSRRTSMSCHIAVITDAAGVVVAQQPTITTIDTESAQITDPPQLHGDSWFNERCARILKLNKPLEMVSNVDPVAPTTATDVTDELLRAERASHDDIKVISPSQNMSRSDVRSSPSRSGMKSALSLSGVKSSHRPGVTISQSPAGAKSSPSPAGIKPSRSSASVKSSLRPTGITTSQSPTGAKSSPSPSCMRPAQSPSGMRPALSPSCMRPAQSPFGMRPALSPSCMRPAQCPSGVKSSPSSAGMKRSPSSAGVRSSPSSACMEPSPSFTGARLSMSPAGRNSLRSSVGIKVSQPDAGGISTLTPTEISSFLSYDAAAPSKSKTSNRRSPSRSSASTKGTGDRAPSPFSKNR